MTGPSRTENGRGRLFGEGTHYCWLKGSSHGQIFFWRVLLNCSVLSEQAVPNLHLFALYCFDASKSQCCIGECRQCSLQCNYPPTALRRCHVCAAYPRMEAWFNWFQRTQAGQVPGTFRWRGRGAAPDFDTELNRKTFASGSHQILTKRTHCCYNCPAKSKYVCVHGHNKKGTWSQSKGNKPVEAAALPEMV